MSHKLRRAENGISVSPKSGLQNITAEISSKNFGEGFQKEISGPDTLISNSEFNSLSDGLYLLTLTAETGTVKIVPGTIENGREGKTYHLKETVTQQATLRISDHKVVIPKSEEK